MSKVKIQGHASGSGVLTITAPNTSTDRTITLPDSTGTLATTADVPAGISSSADATAMTITSDEKIGIGTASPSEPLHVAGSGNSTKIRIQNTKSGTTTGAELEMVSEDGTWQLGQGRGSLHDGDDEDFHIYNSGTKLWIKKTNGNVYIPSGNLVIGTNGKGIDFSANADSSATGASTTSELLDDYEEGTWSPVISRTSTAPTLGTYTSRSGSYIKIGNVVWIHCYFRMDAISGGSGTWSITNLPFAPLTGGNETAQSVFANYNYINGVDQTSSNGNVARWQANNTSYFAEYSTTATTDHTSSVFLKGFTGCYRTS